MEFKKIVSLSAALMILCGSAYAESINVEKNNSKITVKTVVGSGETAVMRIGMDGHALNEYNYIYAFDEAVADSDGNIVFEFNMPETKNDISSDGKYNVYIKSDSGIEKKGSFWYASEESRIALEELLDSADGDKLYEIVSDENNKIALSAAGFAMDLYNEVSDKEDICKEAAKSSDAAKAFTELSVVAYINEADDAEKIAEALSYTDFEFDGTEFSDIEDEKITDWISSCILENGSYSDFDDVSDEYVRANVLYEAQNTRFNKLKALFKKYEDELGISGEDAYEDYMDASDSVSKKVEEKIKDEKPSDVSELLDIFEDCLPKKNGGSSSGGSSGGGGGGYSTKVTNNLPVLVTDKKEEAEPENKKEFSDMSEASWAETAVYAMAEKGIVSGDGDGTFRPNDSVTREEFVKMIIVAAQKHDADAECDFTDVSKSAWYASYVASANKHGIVKGISETEFGIGATLTRQDMAVICARVLTEFNNVRDDVVFSDESEISDYSKDSIHKLYTAGLIDGMGENAFSPKTSATRAQAAQIIYNLFVK